MRVIVLASQKGGAGKSTVAAHLAVISATCPSATRPSATPGRTALIDTDPQGTLTKWWELREAESPALARVPIDGIAGKLTALRRQGFPCWTR